MGRSYDVDGDSPRLGYHSHTSVPVLFFPQVFISVLFLVWWLLTITNTFSGHISAPNLD